MINDRLAEFIHLHESNQTSLLLPEDIDALRKNISAWVDESDKKELSSLLRCYPTAEAIESHLKALLNEAEKCV